MFGITVFSCLIFLFHIHETALRKRESPKDRYGLFDGTKYVFEEKKWAVLTYIDLFMRYGFDLFKVDSMIHDLLKDFSK